jgi:hypothetical protein
MNISFNNNTLSNKLKEHFKDNIKISLKTVDKVFIITSKDVFYEIDLYGEDFSSFVSNNDISIIETMIVKELCNKQIIELTSGLKH